MTHRTTRIPFAALALLVSIVALAGTARAQTPLAEFTLPGPLGQVGDRVGVAGDVDGDGVNDLLVAGDVGVITYSGATQAILGFQPITLATSSDGVLNVDGFGDADGDGQPDLVVATEVEGAKAFSRADGSLLWHVPGSPVGSIGWRMGVLNDVDGDGVRDIALGEPDADPAGLSSAGSIHVISGADGSLIHRIDGTASGQKLGRAIAAFADLDDDGRQDILVGDKDFELHGQQVGRLLVLSPVDGTPILQVVGPEPTVNFGIEVADLGDVDGDGVHDLGAISVVNSIAAARAWSGADGTLIWNVNVAQIFNMRSLGDANGDGAPELVVASPGYLGFPGSGTMLDGATGALLAPLQGASPGTFLGVAAPGDLTGDGLPELLVGTANAGSFSMIGAHADVRSVPGGQLLFTIFNEPNGTGLGRLGAVLGDIDGDGRDDVALATGGKLALFSGASGDLLSEADIQAGFVLFSSGPTAMAAPGDVSGDGVPDVVFGDGAWLSAGTTGTGRVVVHSGADGQELMSLVGATTNEAFGTSLAVVPDRDADGVPDLWVGSENKLVDGIAGAGELQLRSGATLALIDAIPGPLQASARFGHSLDAGGDLTGDGLPELAVGSWAEQPGGLDAGSLYVLDGADGKPVMIVAGGLGSQHVRGAIVGDGNGDGVPDVLAVESAWKKAGESTTRGRMRFYSGATHALLWTREGPEAGSSLGFRFGAAGDVDGDGYADVIASARYDATGGSVGTYSGRDGAPIDTIDLAPGLSSPYGVLMPYGHHDAGGCADVLVGITDLDGNGGARVFASVAGGVHGFLDVGHAKATGTGALPTLSGYGDLGANQLVTLTARDLPPGTTGTWFIGLSAAYLPFKQGVLVPDPFGPFFLFPIVADGNGTFSITAPNPPVVFAGLTIHHQMWVIAPGASANLAATNGLTEIFK